MKEPLQAMLRLKGNFPELSPKMFGAKADGTTDDTKAIQQCIDVCELLRWAIYHLTHKTLEK